MRDYAVFTLYGPMASWGEIAVGSIRGSAARPTRSALIGLLCAALGVKRDDEHMQQRMIEAYRFAVRVDHPGTSIRDFHTWQWPRPKRGVRWETRKEELEADVINTGLSSRDYACDAMYTVCLWAVVQEPPFPLDEIRSAVREPRFVLYLGRKACPPCLPLAVKLVRAASVREAFDQGGPSTLRGLLKPIRMDAPLFFWDDDPHVGMEAQDTFTRRDVPLNRRAWQFTERHEHFGRPVDRKGE